MMLISNQVKDVFSWELIRLQQDTKYNILLAYSDQFSSLSALITSAEWLWSESCIYKSVVGHGGLPHPGYDPRWVRPTIEAEFKKLGYFGPVSITAYDDYKQTPDHVLQGLSSTGVDLSQTIFEFKNRFIVADMCRWNLSNPIPDTMMLISNLVGDGFTASLVGLLQAKKCNFVLAYLFRPTEMPVLFVNQEDIYH
ncbi:unnamed protein product [Cochlearia groenlandica]